MTSREIAAGSVQSLIDTYTQAPEGRNRKVDVLHDDFKKLPKDTRKLIEGVLKEVYRGDFEIVRKAFVGKLEFFLRLIADELKEAGCVDDELQEKISTVREQIATVVNEVEVSEEDMKWLRKIGFLPIDIFKLTVKLDIFGMIAELRENIDEYKLILGHEKYIVKILKMYEGLDKLRRLRSFYRNYNSDIVEFNGYHLSQIVRNADWEEKLKYFENKENLKRLTEAGFNGYHLSQIVRNADWEEKLKYFENEENLKRLTEAGFNGHHLSQIVLGAGWEEKLKYFENKENLKRLTEAGFNGYHLSQIVVNAGWEEKLKYFKNEENLKRLTEAGFNGPHLSQIVRNASWEEKLKYFENEENLKRLTEAGFNGSHLSQIVLGAGWEEKLKYFENEENLKRLTEAGFNGSHLSQIVLGAGWEEKLKVVLSESCLALVKKGILTHNKLAKLFKKKTWRTQLCNLGVSL